MFRVYFVGTRLHMESQNQARYGSDHKKKGKLSVLSVPKLQPGLLGIWKASIIDFPKKKLGKFLLNVTITGFVRT
jgi:hypothetical protein